MSCSKWNMPRAHRGRCSCTPEDVDTELLDLNRVAMFVQIANAGGVTAAAAKMKLPKSSVSRALTQLESELGVELVVRSSRRFRLTDAGRTFVDAAAKGIETVVEARDEILRDKSVPRGVVRIAAPPNFATAILAPTVAQFVRQHPDVHVELSVTAQHVDPVRDGFDLVMSTGKLVDSSSRVRMIKTLDSGVFASSKYLRERGTPRRPNELTRHECILRAGAGKKDRWELTGPSGTVVVAVCGRIRVDDLFTAGATAAEHGGLVLLPLHFRNVDEASGPLERVLPEYVVRGEPAQLVYPASRHVPLRVAMLRDAIVSYTKTNCPSKDDVRGPAATSKRAGGRPDAARSAPRAPAGATEARA